MNPSTPYRPTCACARRPFDGLRRREWLLGAAGALTLAGCAAGGPATPTSRPAAIVDVHHHVSPPNWLRAIGVQVEPPVRQWSAERSLADMDAGGVRMSIVSVAQPALQIESLGRDERRRLARENNEFMAGLAQRFPGRFGFFANLPLTDTEGSLCEIAYAVDVLKADGFGLLTNYGDKWLGDPSFDPVMAEFDRRGSVVYTHPTLAACCVNLQANVPSNVVEFGADTTRTIASILFDGNAVRFPRIRWIFSHAGGAMPFLNERFVQAALRVPKLKERVPDGVLAHLGRFWYDTAAASNATTMRALTGIVPSSRILFGSDFPFRGAAEQVAALRTNGVFDAQALASIESGAAAALLPATGTVSRP